MSLQQIFQSYRDSVRGFYDDEAAGVLVVSAAPEAEALAARLIASVDAEPLRQEISFAHTGPFDSPIQYYRAASQSILDNLAEHEEALRAAQLELEPPEPLDLEAEFPIEVAFAEFVERCSRSLAGARVGQRTVVVLHAANAHDAPVAEREPFITSALSLGSLAATQRTKFVVFASAEASGGDSTHSPRRLEVVAPAHDEQRAQVLDAFCASVSSRVLVLRHGIGLAPTPGEIQEAALRVGLSASLLHVRLAPAPLHALASAAVDALAAREDARALPELRPDRRRLAPIDYLAQLCEDWARSLDPVRGCCIIVLSLTGWGEDDLERARELVMALNVAACSPRVRYLVLDGSGAGLLPELTEAPRRIARLRVAPDADGVEAGLAAQLKEPDLPVTERIRCLDGLATLARTRRQHAEALALHEEALVLADGAGDPASSFQVWHGIGQSYHHAEDWQSAEQAFSKALTVSLDAELTPGVAQSMLSLAGSLLCAGKLEDAELCYRSAVDWYDKLGAPLFSCHALTWLGETQRRAKQLDAAVGTWDDTLARYARLGDDFRNAVTEGKKQVLGRLIRVHEERDDGSSAARCQRALDSLGDASVLTERP